MGIEGIYDVVPGDPVFHYVARKSRGPFLERPDN